MLKILKFLYGSLFLMFRGCIRFDVVVVRSLIQIKNILFTKWWKRPLKDSTNLKKRNLDSSSKVKKQFAQREIWFRQASFEKIFYFVVFSCINLPLTAKYASEKLIAK